MMTSCSFVSDVELAKCNEYKDLEPGLSSSGQAWSKYVRSCLQKSLGEYLLQKKGSSYTCDDAQKEFLDAHIPCYLDGPTDFCSIGLMDKISVFWHAKGMLTKAFWDVVISAGKLKWQCDNRFYEGLLRKITINGDDSIMLLEDDPFQVLKDRLNNASTNIGWDSGLQLTETANNFNVGFQRLAQATNSTVDSGVVAGWIVDIASKMDVWDELVLDGVTYPIKKSKTNASFLSRE